MFVHSDRLPNGSPLPSGHFTRAPWGLQRMAPYPEFTPGYARTELDPATQTARYFDGSGQPVMMPGHGTSTGTNPPTNTGNPSDGSSGGGSGGGDQDTGNDGDQ
ncbi:putative ATP-grasp-modified RiPP [Streptomyces malaysiensis]|uniref:ATP-grasp-modified RiPP n=1 Tax=Streptomyces malaysiensis subsp. samsunensis TaxID=459658 RepID=A0A9X2LSQ6_STRMQ|nr:putative ATP-grasp-modified RiPP [Streptomyces samsunensis]MCQ8829098.1 putative ATP-grasp-modified RiPP [Streptomyces samsunensis]